MSRAEGLQRLENFVPKAGPRYARTRNFDFGPGRQGDVSHLSPFVRHRLILEEEILDATLQQHSLSAASRFVQEVFWRTYFKGWLEHHPSVWNDYREELARDIDQLDQSQALRDRFEAAVKGRTGIECFDTWTRELTETGYLHNHVRMWFASIWIYTLKLPWKLGADFFYRHLLDGDPASNTCSWRWVCGLHTRGKTYLARPSNIERYTDGRFHPEGQLACSAPALSENMTHPVQRLPGLKSTAIKGRCALLVTEEDCFPESLSGLARPEAIVGVSLTGNRSPLEVGKPVMDFAGSALTDALDRAGKKFGLSKTETSRFNTAAAVTDWARDREIDTIMTAYAPVGPVAEMLSQLEKTLATCDIGLVTLRRKYDETTWPHTRRGYFKLRQKIPNILEQLKIRQP